MAIVANAIAPQVCPFSAYPAAPDLDSLASMHANAGLAAPAGAGKPESRNRPRAANSAPAAAAKRLKPADRTADGDAAEGDNEGDDARRKRSRGRPRLDTKDETAADRRRTQIRLAQRAYRHRKDAAITTLEQKVKDFEEAHQSINEEFSDLYDVLVAEGVLEAAPHAGPRLRAIADRFLALASTASKDGSGSQSTSDDGTVARKMAASSNWSGELAASVPESLAYEVVTQPTPDSAGFPLYASMEPAPQQFMTPLPSPSPYSDLPPPSSLAAHEVTFGRRLQRANTEAGLRLITMSNPPPQLYASVFGFCLFFESREAIISRLTASLNRTQLESLGYWRAPFTNLGGAGTLFLGSRPADGSDKGSLPMGNQGTDEYGKQHELTGFSMGPFSAQVEATEGERLDERLRMLLPGFEGDFFDADEVETYLGWLGITIPQSVDFVEAEINLGDLDDDGNPPGPMVRAGEREAFARSGLPSSDSGYGSISGPAGGSGWPGSSPEVKDALMAPAAAEAVPTESMAPMLSAGGAATTGAPVLNGELAAFMCPPDLGGVWASAANWSRARVSINVNVLVDEMVHRSVCLGRAPGVQRRDVNRAVKIAAGLAPAQ